MSNGRVVVVDDNASMRLLVGMHLDTDGWEVVGDAADAEGGLALVRELQPDAVVLDQELPGGPGTRVLPLMLASCPGVRVVLFSADAVHAQVGAEAGAVGFLLKGDPLSGLTPILRG